MEAIFNTICFLGLLVLFNLNAGAKGLLARHGRSDELDLIFQSYANAVRRFSGG